MFIVVMKRCTILYWYFHTNRGEVSFLVGTAHKVFDVLLHRVDYCYEAVYQLLR